MLFVLSLTSPAFLATIVTTEDKAGLLLSGIVLGLVVCFFKKLGWTGFVVPKLRKRYGIFATGLTMDLLWGAWHLSLFSGSAGSSDALALLGRAPLLAPPGLQGTHGWGLRPYRKLSRSDAHARPSCWQPDHPHASGDISGIDGVL